MKNYRVHYIFNGKAGSIVVPAMDTKDAYAIAAEKLEDVGLGNATITNVEERQVNNRRPVR